MQTTKNKNALVVKPVKGNFINLFKKNKETKENEAVTILTVVDQDGDVVATFNEKDYGPRFVFKATQYANQNSALDQMLTVKELS